MLSLGALSAPIKSGRCGASSPRAGPRVCRHTHDARLGYQENCSASGSAFRTCRNRRREEGPVGAIEQAVKAPAITARLASLGILQSYATPEQTTAEIRAEFNRVSQMARKTGVAK